MKRILFFVITICFLSCNIEPKELKEVTSVDQAKKRIDWLLDSHMKTYKELCSGPRNDDAKEKFSDLMFSLQEYWTCGEKCSKLDYKDQKEVSDYAISKLKSSELYELEESGKIPCW